jgi:hypothetical protein
MAKQVNHGTIADVLGASRAVEAALMPVLAGGVDEAAFRLESKNRATAGATGALAPAVLYEAWSAEESVARIWLQWIWIDRRIWRECGATNSAGK